MLLKVLVGYDFTELADLALRQAIFMAEKLNASELHLVCALDNELIRRGLITALDEENSDMMRLRTRQTVHEHLSRIERSEMHVVVHAPIGHADAAILGIAATVEADIIVVGTHGRGGLTRLLVGSVAASVMRKANCPVFVARPKSYEHEQQEAEPGDPGERADVPYMEPHTHTQHTWAPLQSAEWPLY